MGIIIKRQKKNSASAVSKPGWLKSARYDELEAEKDLFVVEELRLSLNKATEENIEIRRLLDECMTEVSRHHG